MVMSFGVKALGLLMTITCALVQAQRFTEDQKLELLTENGLDPRSASTT